MLERLYQCKNDQRRALIRTRVDADGLPLLNGIDYLEVASDQRTLLVYLIHNPVGVDLDDENLLIDGGTRLRDVRVESASVAGRLLTVRVNTTGDLSPYTLRLVQSPDQLKPPATFDSQLSQVEFRFQVVDRSEFDCQTPPALTEKAPPPPAIDYLAKDYASFRQLMLDRLAVTLPQWKERSPADLGVMLIELVAYAGDHLSYYQDAVATEAYLGTARKRVSVRRHARLLNYPMHDGCNARAWVALQVRSQGSETLGSLPGLSVEEHRAGTQFLTRVPDLPIVLKTQQELDKALNAGAQVFETLHDLPLHSSCNRLHFYTWGDRSCSLPKGAYRATLHDPDRRLGTLLVPGKVLIFEEVKGPQTGLAVDADPSHRYAVRLTQVEVKEDPLFGIGVVDIEWATEDALPLPLIISTVVGDRPVNNITVVWGNVVMVDHGRTITREEHSVDASSQQRFRPRLVEKPLTQQRYVRNRKGQLVPFDVEPSSALGSSVLLQRSLEDVQPAIVLQEESGAYWYPKRDLLNSDRFARDFVVEMEDDGRAYLRFGDNVLGRRPESDTTLIATYRVGNGTVGNVGGEAIAHLFSSDPAIMDVIDVTADTVANDQPLRAVIRNPLPAKGGIDPEPIEQVRLYAPQAFRTQQRAVTEKDYAEVTQRFPSVRRALATRRWTGSWYTIFITVDRDNNLPIDDAFKQALLTFLEQFRLTAQELEIEAPRFIPLDLSLTIKVLADYFSDQVEEALLKAFSNTVLLDGQLGFFHPDNFTFGQPVYLSKVIEKAMQVKGVQSVTVKRFQRFGRPAQKELENAQIPLDHLEIALLDNDPGLPERGRITFDMEGGL